MEMLGIRMRDNDVLKRAVIRTIEKINQKQPEKEIIFLTDSPSRLEYCLEEEEYKIVNVEDGFDIVGNVSYLLFFESDEQACEVMKAIKKENVDSIVCGIDMPCPVSRYMDVDDICLSSMKFEYDVQTEFGITQYFEPNDFQGIAQALNMTKDIDGDYVEVGAYLGCSGRFALKYMTETRRRKAWIFDTFEGFCYDAANKSQDALWSNTHKVDIDIVKARLERDYDKNLLVVEKNNIITDDLPKDIKKIAVANLDVDMYEAVVSGLVKLGERMAPGGVLICEDAGHTPMLYGAQLACREFLETDLGKTFIPVWMSSGQLFLIKK